MQKWTLTLCIGIVLSTLIAILAYPKLTDGQDKISTEFVPLKTAEMPKKRARVQTEDEPVRVHFGLRVVAEQRQADIKESADLLNK